MLWITPLRALTNDIKKAMQEVCDEIGIPWKIATRTGDTSAAEKYLSSARSSLETLSSCTSIEPIAEHQLDLLRPSYDKLMGFGSQSPKPQAKTRVSNIHSLLDNNEQDEMDIGESDLILKLVTQLGNPLGESLQNSGANISVDRYTLWIR